MKASGFPTRKDDWVKVGDRCVSSGGMGGEVLHLTSPATGLPSATVKWDNGYTGRLTITHLRREAR